MTQQYYTRKWGPGKCRNGHDKGYAGECAICVDARRVRKRKKPAPGTRVGLTEADVQRDVEAMRVRVALRRERLAVRRSRLAP